MSDINRSGHNNVVNLRGITMDSGEGPQTSSFKIGGGDGTSGGMESRIARLESDMGHVKDTLKSIDGRLETVRGSLNTVHVDAATMKADIKHLPSKGFVVTATTTSIGILTGIIIFGDKIRVLLGL